MVPQDDREGFVIGKDIDPENKSFRIIFSSKRLLSLMVHFKVVAADCTFKVTLEGYPLLVVAVIDNMRHAHPVAFGVISNQKQTDYQYAFQAVRDACSRFGYGIEITTFMSDGEQAIKKAARSAFRNPKVLNCYFHVMQNITKHFKQYREIPEELQGAIKHDIAVLQGAPTAQHFTTGMKLFLHKYERFPHFMAFMQKYVNDANFCLWYEAAAPGVPATNNAVEALNKSLKYNHMYRHKEPLAVFKTIILSIVEEYGDPQRTISLQRNYDSITNQRKAFDWLKTEKKMRTCNDASEGRQYVYLPGKNKQDISLHDIQEFENPQHQCFEHFTAALSELHRVDVSSYNWRCWNCTCYFFAKKQLLLPCCSSCGPTRKIHTKRRSGHYGVGP